MKTEKEIRKAIEEDEHILAINGYRGGKHRRTQILSENEALRWVLDD